jgi:multiple sugar transport system permease protein
MANVKLGRSYSNKKRKGMELLPFLFLLPSIFMVLIVKLYPITSGLMYSLEDSTILVKGDFVGLHNFQQLMSTDTFWKSIVFTFIFSFFSVVGSYLVGLGLSILLNKKIPGSTLFRAGLLVPWVIPSIVSIVCWRWMLGSQDSMVNLFLGLFGIEPILFLANEKWAVFSVILVKIWRSFPFMLVSILAALQSIDESLYEAAAIDGSNRFRSFWHITMPHLKNVSIVSCIFMATFSFNDFETIWLLTQGGPNHATESLTILTYIYTIVGNQLGLGAASAVISLIMLMILAVILLRIQEDKE